MDFFNQLQNFIILFQKQFAPIFQFFQNENVKFWILWFKIFLGVSSLFLAIIIFHAIRNSTYLRYRIIQDLSDFFRSGVPIPPKRIVRKWQEIQRKLASAEESNWKLAIIEADNIMDEILKNMGYKGTTLEERLKQVQLIHIPHLNDLWNVHKTRNLIVRDPEYRLSNEKAREAIEIYRKAFEDLELLE